MIKNEKTLNYYFNKGKFNHPSEIGYVMNSIRESSPLTVNEWRTYYYENVRSKQFLNDLSERMYESMSDRHKNEYNVEQCFEYISDVIFRRTFEGYNKENIALNIINEKIDVRVELSPKEWDGKYFIDFLIKK